MSDDEVVIPEPPATDSPAIPDGDAEAPAAPHSAPAELEKTELQPKSEVVIGWFFFFNSNSANMCLDVVAVPPEDAVDAEPTAGKD